MHYLFLPPFHPSSQLASSEDSRVQMAAHIAGGLPAVQGMQTGSSTEIPAIKQQKKVIRDLGVMY